jgi:hypothetical protein
MRFFVVFFFGDSGSINIHVFIGRNKEYGSTAG